MQARMITSENINSPQGYKKLYNFHKYWGKKPHEPLAFAIEQLTDEGDIVLDPFVGSGTTARESLIRNRRFIGFDINPIAIELTKMIISPPNYFNVYESFNTIKNTVKDEIDSSYRLQDGRIASHYLWTDSTLEQVWLRGGRGRAREELSPSSEDIALFRKYDSYQSKHIRSPRFFSNSRINTHSDLSTSDILTGRAQYNIDLLIDCIEDLPPDVRNPMKLCLTSASGQMSKMVFAITGRGKTTGKRSTRTEVGSWVIGYWRPNLHFEVNVWNCFERRVSMLLNAIKPGDPLQGLCLSDSMENFFEQEMECYISGEPCQTGITNIKEKSVSLILTDPPHSDRIPYLELSELWNSILNTEVSFDSEIVVSNAKERGKTLSTYNNDMYDVIRASSHIMQDDAFLLMLYNSRGKSPWTFISQVIDSYSELQYHGTFPCYYSALSVVQDNRRGSLKDDAILVFGKPQVDSSKLDKLATIPAWSPKIPIK